MAELLGDVALGLLGEHLDDRTGRSVADHVAELAEVGVRSIATVTGRGGRHVERIRALVDAGAVGVLCVTGDHPAARDLDVAVDFATEGTALAAMARVEGAPAVLVAESPASPPYEGRVERVLEKERAGADGVVLNHAGDPAAAIAFVDSLMAERVDLGVVAPVPVITDRSSAAALTQFPGVALPAGHVERIVSAPDPRRAGVLAAADWAAELLAHPAIDAVNLSGSATAAGVVERARVMRDVIDAIDAIGDHDRASDPCA